MTVSEDEIAAVEAAVMARLSAWEAPSEAGGAVGAGVAPEIRKGKLRKRRRRRERAVAPPDAAAAAVRNAAELAAEAERRAVERAVVRVWPAREEARARVREVVVAPRELRPVFGRRRAAESVKVEGGLDSREMVEAFRREVGVLGSTALGKKDRSNYETAELVRLGCKPPRNQKMPLGLLLAKRKKEKLQAEKDKQHKLETGMLVRSKRK